MNFHHHHLGPGYGRPVQNLRGPSENWLQAAKDPSSGEKVVEESVAGTLSTTMLQPTDRPSTAAPAPAAPGPSDTRPGKDQPAAVEYRPNIQQAQDGKDRNTVIGLVPGSVAPTHIPVPVPALPVTNLTGSAIYRVEFEHLPSHFSLN